MKRHRIVLPCVLGVGLLGCQTVPPTSLPYVQRDLTVPWSEHTYWSVPASPMPDPAMPTAPGAQRTVKTPSRSPALTCTGEGC